MTFVLKVMHVNIISRHGQQIMLQTKGQVLGHRGAMTSHNKTRPRRQNHTEEDNH